MSATWPRPTERRLPPLFLLSPILTGTGAGAPRKAATKKSTETREREHGVHGEADPVDAWVTHVVDQVTLRKRQEIGDCAESLASACRHAVGRAAVVFDLLERVPQHERVLVCGLHGLEVARVERKVIVHK
eukprot:scaffold88388_cov29-Tisochrysis_lutea.AAC.2